jgi:hypothetical protein
MLQIEAPIPSGYERRLPGTDLVNGIGHVDFTFTQAGGVESPTTPLSNTVGLYEK